MRANVDGHIAGGEEAAQLIDGLLRDVLFGLARMEPLRVVDFAVLAEVEGFDFAAVGLRFGTHA